MGRESQSLPVREKKLLKQTSLLHLGMVTKNHAIYQDNEYTPTRIRKWNQLNQFR